MDRDAVLAVVVVFARPLAAVMCLSRLEQWLSPGSRCGLRLDSVLIYDNSPVSMDLSSGDTREIKERVFYCHDPSNGGTRAAFMRAADMARTLGCNWLLLLDHDTELPSDMLESMSNAIATEMPCPDALVPRVVHGEIAVSPAIINDLGIVRALSLNASADNNKRLTAIASGSLFSVKAFEEIGTIPSGLWLDGVDHWLFCRLHNLGRTVKVVETTLSHDLSVTDIATMPAWRVVSLLESEAILLRLLPVWASLAFPYRVLRMMQRCYQADPKLMRPVIGWLLARLTGRNTAIRSK